MQELVDLLLVLHHREPRLRVVHDELHLLLDRVLIERHGHAAERLRGEHRPVERGAVVTHDRGLVAPREAERGQPQRDEARFRQVLAPAMRLPDPEVLLAHGDLAAEAARIIDDELGEGIERGVERAGGGGRRACHASAPLETVAISGGKRSSIRPVKWRECSRAP
jgi:hypothetical protein